ncbi:MAG TPA: efflux RND transporter periplasmic adaptor subunit [Steroidobacteraceae bacterium]|nr:efflux RND transporter periplasmic adaptor subunit [Steroidobacteraceae bacterium]
MEQAELSLVRRALPPGKQIRVVLVIVLAAAGALAVGWGALRARASEPAPTQEATASNEVRLTSAQLATLEINTVATRAFRTEEVTDGQIALNGDTTTQVFSPYSGRVVRVLASPGEYVKQGAPLLRIEASEFVQAQSDLLNTAAALKLARINEARKHAAYDSKGGSLQDWQQAQADLAAAENASTSAANRLRILGKTTQEIAAIETAKKTDAATYVVAPIGGIVTDRQVGPGQYIQSGASSPVFSIGDLSTVWLVAAVPETDAPFIERGQTVEVRVLALPGQIFKAKLTAIGAQVDPVTRRVPVRATLANADGKLKPQMFASFSIITSGDSQAPAVPEEAIVREGDQARVWVVAENDMLTLRSIRTGRSNDGMVEVVEGLKAGERVVTRGSLFIDRAARPG